MKTHWQVRCRKCGLTFDAGDIGVIRIGGAGKSYIFRHCAQCRRLRWMLIEPKPFDQPIHAGPRCALEMLPAPL